MDRRRFFQRAAAPVLPAPDPAAASEAAPPFEVLPGVFVQDGLTDFRYRAARPEADALARRAGGSPLPTSASLAAYSPSTDAPWDARRARHLLRRTGVAAPPEAVEAVLAMSPGEAVATLLDRVVALGVDPKPSWHFTPPPHWSAPRAERDAFQDLQWPQMQEVRLRIVRDLCGIDRPFDPLDEAARSFRHRLTVLWHNHFVTHRESYNLSAFLSRYWRTLQRHALGDLREFVHAIGLDPAMLIYLNGADNRAEAPNENYARELLELFTMGITGPDGAANYTQQDVTEISRALTGYGLDYYGQTDTPLEARFVPEWHDATDKTILGQTGAWGYDDVVRIVFEERAPQIAHRIAAMIYRALVYDVPHLGVVADLADVLLANDFALRPAIQTLLQSEHFFDSASLGARVRSPLEHNCAAYREVGARPKPDDGDDRVDAVWWTMTLQGQNLFEPPTVAGWPGGRAWLDTSRLSSRWLFDSWMIWWDVAYRDLAAAMPDPWSPHALAADLSDALLGQPLTEADRAGLTEILLDGIPDYEWNPLADGAERRVRGLVAHLLRLPEFQLA